MAATFRAMTRLSGCFALGLSIIGATTPLPAGAGTPPPVHTVLFTHIEDNTPGGPLGSIQNRNSYLLYRSRLIDMALLASSYNLTWTLQPDWKILQAALLYEDAALMATTNNKNFLRYIKEDLDAVIDAHSHENGGYNYTDVAHLLDSLGVGGSTVIGGHVWDPSLPQFQEWDRYRVPVAGQQFPWATWRGDILMGSGTPNHVNDPRVSGVWRPRDRDHYFEHDPNGNIAAIGQYLGTVAGLADLVDRYQTGQVSPNCMLTTSHGIRPSILVATGGLAAIEDTLIAPIALMRDAGTVVPTDFTSLIDTWQTSFASYGCLYDPGATSAVGPESPEGAPAVVLEGGFPNPFRAATAIHYTLPREEWVKLVIYDVAGREVSVLVDARQPAGSHAITWNAETAAGGLYFCRIQYGAGVAAAPSRKLLLVR